MATTTTPSIKGALDNLKKASAQYHAASAEARKGKLSNATDLLIEAYITRGHVIRELLDIIQHNEDCNV